MGLSLRMTWPCYRLVGKEVISVRIKPVVHSTLLVLLSACSGQDAANGDAGAQVGGSSTAGGAQGTPVGGSNAGGGANSTAGSASGGSTTTGGTQLSGGASSMGGVDVSGGALATGGFRTSGGATHVGGSPSSGGNAHTGGAFLTGGALANTGGKASGGAQPTGGSKATGGLKSTGGMLATGGASAAGGASTTGGSSSASTTAQGGTGVILYGTPYVNVNMWYGPVDFAESDYHNACGLEDGSLYPTVIQNLYGNYLIGLDGENIANVESHCDNCAQLTANGKTIIARIVTYGLENGVNAIDLSPQAQSALGLSSSNWTGTWQFCSCATGTTPLYYEFDSRQWNPQNFWYMRIWTRNQRLPVKLVETKIGSAAWVAASQESDGAWQTQSGVDFSGGFQVRVTASDNQQLVDTVPALAGLNPVNPIAGHTNFQ